MDYPVPEPGLPGQLNDDIVLLLAVCDVTTPLERYVDLRREGWDRMAAQADVAEFGKGLHWVVQEFAHTRSGRVLALRDRLGWSGRPSRGDAASMWHHVTLDSLTRDVLNVVLPDDTEETGDAHSFARFVESLGAQGIEVTENGLRAVPYHVVFAPRLFDLVQRPPARRGGVITMKDVDAIDRP